MMIWMGEMSNTAVPLYRRWGPVSSRRCAGARRPLHRIERVVSIVAERRQRAAVAIRRVAFKVRVIKQQRCITAVTGVDQDCARVERAPPCEGDGLEFQVALVAVHTVHHEEAELRCAGIARDAEVTACVVIADNHDAAGDCRESRFAIVKGRCHHNVPRQEDAIRARTLRFVVRPLNCRRELRRIRH